MEIVFPMRSGRIRHDTPTMPLSDAPIRNLKPREKTYKV